MLVFDFIHSCLFYVSVYSIWSCCSVFSCWKSLLVCWHILITKRWAAILPTFMCLAVVDQGINWLTVDYFQYSLHRFVYFFCRYYRAVIFLSFCLLSVYFGHSANPPNTIPCFPSFLFQQPLNCCSPLRNLLHAFQCMFICFGFPSFSRLSFSPLFFLLQCFPFCYQVIYCNVFLLPYQSFFSDRLRFFLFEECSCESGSEVRESVLIYFVMWGHCSGSLECYRGRRKLDQELFLLTGGELQVAEYSSCTKVLFLFHSWMRSSNRTWRWPCRRNTSSQERRASHRLSTNYIRRCGSVALVSGKGSNKNE